MPPLASWGGHGPLGPPLNPPLPTPHHSSFFAGRMPFLPPNQQRQSTEGITADTTRQFAACNGSSMHRAQGCVRVSLAASAWRRRRAANSTMCKYDVIHKTGNRQRNVSLRRQMRRATAISYVISTNNSVKIGRAVRKI